MWCMVHGVVWCMGGVWCGVVCYAVYICVLSKCVCLYVYCVRVYGFVQELV